MMTTLGASHKCAQRFPAAPRALGTVLPQPPAPRPPLGMSFSSLSSSSASASSSSHPRLPRPFAAAGAAPWGQHNHQAAAPTAPTPPPSSCSTRAWKSSLRRPGLPWLLLQALPPPPRGSSSISGRGSSRGGSSRAQRGPASTRTKATQADPGSEVATMDLQVDDVMRRIRKAMGISSRPITDEVLVRGTGTHLGIDVGWQVCLRPDGAFTEEIAGCHLSFRWGHDGTQDGQCWEVDDSGVSKQLELDDHEALLLASWIRSCYWLHPDMASRLQVTILPNSNQPMHHPPSAGGAGGEAGGGGGEDPEFFTLGLRLQDGKLQAHLRVCANTWKPLQLIQPMCGDTESWRYLGWKSYCGGLVHPTSVLHQGAPGGHNSFTTSSAELQRKSKAAAALSYSIPPSAARPADTKFLPGVPASVNAWHSRSGHVLVQPKINGQTVGYMILDTGASGFVMEKSAADDLGLGAFGELHVSGMAGKIKCQFRRADSVQIGPLVMQRPLFMEMRLGGVVRGAPGPVVGIVGYDIFRRAVIELPMQKKPNAEYIIKMHDPETFEAPPELEKRWEPLQMVANLPHVKAEFAKPADSTVHTGVFMLDSGAGGVDTMFHARASEEYGLVDSKSNNFLYIKGVGGEDLNSLKVQSGELSWLELSATKLEHVRSLFGGSGGLDLSQYTCGIICADLIGRMHVVVDYPRSRIAFLHKTLPKNNGSSPP